MTDIRHIAPTGKYTAPPLSSAVRVDGLIFVSGTPGYDEDGRIAEGDFGAQFDQAVVNLERVMAAAGGTLRSAVKVNVLLTRQSDVAGMNERYAKAFGPAPYPARTTCVVAALPDPRMLLEIELVASVEGAS